MNHRILNAICLLLTTLVGFSQDANPATQRTLPPALGVPKPGATNEGPYSPQPILQGGVVVPLYSAVSLQLNKERVREAEYYNVSKAVPGRISSITNIHNP